MKFLFCVFIWLHFGYDLVLFITSEYDDSDSRRALTSLSVIQRSLINPPFTTAATLGRTI